MLTFARRRGGAVATALVAGLLLATAAVLPARAQEQGGAMSGGYVLPLADAERGRALFVGKGCVVCHSVNGVGGEAGPPLDVDPEAPYANLFDFTARM